MYDYRFLIFNVKIIPETIDASLSMLAGTQ
jgi:hypothetical protein